MKIKPQYVELKVPLLTGDETLMIVGKWLVSVGDPVEIDQDLVELVFGGETFKLPSPLDGALVTIEAETGLMVEPGQVLAILEMY